MENRILSADAEVIEACNLSNVQAYTQQNKHCIAVRDL